LQYFFFAIPKTFALDKKEQYLCTRKTRMVR
jgi:hypothetical protein